MSDDRGCCELGLEFEEHERPIRVLQLAFQPEYKVLLAIFYMTEDSDRHKTFFFKIDRFLKTNHFINSHAKSILKNPKT